MQGNKQIKLSQPQQMMADERKMVEEAYAGDIIGIFDMDTSTVGKATRDFLTKAEQQKRVQYVNYDLPKSYVLTKETVYISPLNVSTLIKRWK